MKTMPDKQTGIDEVELIQQCKKGDMHSFQNLYELFKDRTFSTAIRMLDSPQDAEKATQDIFIQVFRHLNTFRGDSSLSTWIYKITINTCHNKLRKIRHPDAEDLPDSDNQNLTLDFKGKPPSTIQWVIEQEITQLPARYMSVFILHEIEGFTHKEIAEIMNIAAGTSRSQLSIAKSILRTKLIPYLEVFRDAM